MFRLDESGSCSVLYTFKGATDGADPVGDIALDSAGDLYGVTSAAGAGRSCGTIYEITSTGQFVLLRDFAGGYPLGGVILAPSGEVYGTTQTHGTTGAGVLFKISN